MNDPHEGRQRCTVMTTKSYIQKEVGRKRDVGWGTRPDFYIHTWLPAPSCPCIGAPCGGELLLVHAPWISAAPAPHNRGGVKGT